MNFFAQQRVRDRLLGEEGTFYKQGSPLKVGLVYPNHYYFTNYRGIVRSNLLDEAQYSQRKFRFEGDGGTSRDIIDSPFSALYSLYPGP